MSPGQRYGRYILIRQIGKGNMGTVHLATRIDTGQQVAIKVIEGGSSPDAAEKIALEQAGAEAQKAAKGDPRVVAVNDIIHVSGDLVIEMEYVEGKDLTHFMTGLDAQQAARIARELCLMIDSLASLHPGVLHCDLKPKNVMLLGASRITVMDFGIAKRITNPAGVDNPFQTIPYASPERLRTRCVTVHSELWAVGVILYELTAGMYPFGGGDRNEILAGNGPSRFAPANTCPQALRQIVFKALAPALPARYAAPRDMADDLDRFLAEKPVLAPDTDSTIRAYHPTEGTIRTEDSVPEAHRSKSSADPEPIDPRPHVRVKTVALTVLLCIFLFGAYRWQSARSETNQLSAELDGGKLSLDDAWKKYQSSRSTWFPSDRLKQAIIRKSEEVGERPIHDYSLEKPVSNEVEWQRGAEAFRHLLNFDPNNPTLKGKLRLCEGHLKRIRARYKRNGKPNVDQKVLNMAMDDFNEAARLLPKSPDPYLGLARIYFYDDLDVERGMQAINEASNRGHKPGLREKVEQADGLRQRAARALDQSRQLADMPEQRKQYLERARADYVASLNGYQEVAGFMPTIPKITRDITTGLKQIDGLLGALGRSK